MRLRLLATTCLFTGKSRCLLPKVEPNKSTARSVILRRFIEGFCQANQCATRSTQHNAAWFFFFGGEFFGEEFWVRGEYKFFKIVAGVLNDGVGVARMECGDK